MDQMISHENIPLHINLDKKLELSGLKSGRKHNLVCQTTVGLNDKINGYKEIFVTEELRNSSQIG